MSTYLCTSYLISNRIDLLDLGTSPPAIALMTGTYFNEIPGQVLLKGCDVGKKLAGARNTLWYFGARLFTRLCSSYLSCLSGYVDRLTGKVRGGRGCKGSLLYVLR